jgi:hypothetical protein
LADIISHEVASRAPVYVLAAFTKRDIFHLNEYDAVYVLLFGWYRFRCYANTQHALTYHERQGMDIVDLMPNKKDDNAEIWAQNSQSIIQNGCNTTLSGIVMDLAVARREFIHFHKPENWIPATKLLRRVVARNCGCQVI